MSTSVTARHMLTAVGTSLLAGCLLLACGDDGARPSLVESDAGPSLDAGGDAANDGDRPPFDGRPPAVECAVTPCMTRLVAGPSHYCALSSDGVVYCWGSPTALGEFAAGSTPGGNPGAFPTALTGIGDVLEIGASTLRTCIAHNDGTVDCLGLDMPKPTRVPSVSSAKKLAVGEERSCAVASGDMLSCWGDSVATGKGDTTIQLGSEKVASAAVSGRIGLAVDAKGALFSWGNDAFMLGRDTPLEVDWTPAASRGSPPSSRWRLRIVTCAR